MITLDEQIAKYALADRVVIDVAELPRSSPEGQPNMMLVTPDELHGIVSRHLEAILATLRSVKQAEPVAWWKDQPMPVDLSHEPADFAEAKEMLKRVRAHVAAAPAAPQSGWQPIETAPKGPKVLVAYETAPGKWWRVLARYWPANTLESDHDESGFAKEGWYEATEAYEELMPVEAEPTFWHPLPAAPGREG